MIKVLVPDLPAAAAIARAIAPISDSRYYTNFGPMACQLEQRVGALVHAGVVTTASGSAALEACLITSGLPAGARVLVPSFTFPASVLAVLRCGFQAILCDIDPLTWTMTPAIANAVLRRMEIDACLPVSTFGLPLPGAEWSRFTQDTGLPVIMDAASALGHQTVADGITVAFSLHATKPLGIGEGGIAASRDPDRVERMRRATNFGFEQNDIIDEGFNGKLCEWVAAIGLLQLDRWPDLRQRRNGLWRRYRSLLADLPGLAFQECAGDWAPSVFVARMPLPAGEVAEALAAAGVQTRCWYCPPVHHHPRFAACPRIGPDGGPDLPVTEDMARHALGLPFHTFLTDDDLAAVAAALRAVVCVAGVSA